MRHWTKWKGKGYEDKGDGKSNTNYANHRSYQTQPALPVFTNQVLDPGTESHSAIEHRFTTDTQNPESNILPREPTKSHQKPSNCPVKSRCSLSNKDELVFFTQSELSAMMRLCHSNFFVFIALELHHSTRKTLHIWYSTCLFHQIRPPIGPTRHLTWHLTFSRFWGVHLSHWQRSPAKNPCSFPRGNPKMAMPSNKSGLWSQDLLITSVIFPSNTCSPVKFIWAPGMFPWHAFRTVVRKVFGV